MAMVAPKTIVITSLPARSSVMTSRPLSSAAASLPLSVTEGLGINGEPKKRKRLTNLTPEERLMRRKLKNRVAAQTARDRKKQRMDELETMLTQIEAENKRLQAENNALRIKTGKLTTENIQLKERLGQTGSDDDDSDSEALVTRSPGSAALNTPQQQEQILSPVLHSSLPRQSRLVQMILTVSLICCLASWKNCPVLLRKRKKLATVKRLQQPSHRPAPHINWWGPQQQNWNPSMN